MRREEELRGGRLKARVSRTYVNGERFDFNLELNVDFGGVFAPGKAGHAPLPWSLLDELLPQTMTIRCVYRTPMEWAFR